MSEELQKEHEIQKSNRQGKKLFSRFHLSNGQVTFRFWLPESKIHSSKKKYQNE